MRLPILITVLILIVVIGFAVRRGKDQYARDEADFWEKERRANSTRRKSLDGLKLISVPLDRLPTDVCTDDPRIAEYVEIVTGLAETRIANLTGISNTDLKLQYGAPNITELSKYDQRYTALASTLQRWADALLEKGERDAAQVILEYAVEIGTDVSGTYRALAKLYDEAGDKDSIRALIPKAEALNTPMKDSILHALNERLTC